MNLAPTDGPSFLQLPKVSSRLVVEFAGYLPLRAAASGTSLAPMSKLELLAVCAATGWAIGNPLSRFLPGGPHLYNEA